MEWDSLKGIVIFPRSINIAFLSNCANEILSKGVTEAKYVSDLIVSIKLLSSSRKVSDDCLAVVW